MVCPECGATRYRINGSIGMGEPRYRQRCTRGCPSDFAPLGPPVCASCMNLAIAATAEGPYCQDCRPPDGTPLTGVYNQLPDDVPQGEPMKDEIVDLSNAKDHCDYTVEMIKAAWVYEGARVSGDSARKERAWKRCCDVMAAAMSHHRNKPQGEP